MKTPRKRAYIPRWKLPRHRIKPSKDYLDAIERSLLTGGRRRRVGA